MKKKIIAIVCLFVFYNTHAQNNIVVFQTDFGNKDGAVSAMKGVAMGIDPQLKLYDLTHDIPAYNIWEAAYRLDQTVPYWPAGTVFVSVVDPGVGTSRRSVVVKTKTGHFIVSPDNGTLTLIAASLGIDSIREIDEKMNRRENSEASYTFHGRDVYAFTAAKLASHIIKFEQVGPLSQVPIKSIPYEKANFINGLLKGNIDILDIQYGNIWTNIDIHHWNQFKSLPHQKNKIQVQIYHGKKLIYTDSMPFENTFGAVAPGKPLAYLNSLMHFSLALNQSNMAKIFHISSGPDWHISIRWMK
jgi:S-adenosylmethionine hydrolase